MPHIAAAAAAAVATVAPAGVTAAVASTATAAAAKVGFMATMKSVAMKALANYAITAAMSAFQPQVGVAGRPVEWTLNPDGPIPFAAGRVGVAGSVIHKETFGPDLMYYGLVSVLSGAGPIDGFVNFKGDDEFVSFDANGKAVTSQWRDEMWLKTTLGNQPDAALATPVGLKKNATLPGWGASYRLSGKAAYMLVMGENSKRSAYPMGEVKPIHVIRGLRVWDPRLDSTYPGGSGSCRLHDSATWVYSANPYLWAIKWGLGLWEGPSLKGAPAHGSTTDYQVGGIGAKLSGIDVPTLVAAANIADANGWVCAAYPTTDDDKSQVLDAFLQAGGGIYAQRAGKISCIQRAAPRTSIANITAADTAGPIEIDTAASRIDRINTIRPRYWSEAHRWQMQALDDVTAEAYRDEDGGTRSRPLDFHYVPAARQAGQLAALQIAHTREGIAGVIPLKPHLQRIKPGDCFTITEPGFVLNGQKFLCLNTEYDPATKVVRVTFVSETDGKYAWALGQDSMPPAPPVLTPVDPTYVSPPLPEDWTISPRPPSPGGGQVPGFDLSGAVSNETATAVLVEYGPTADGPWKQAYQGPPTVQNIPLDGVQPGATYFVGVRYQRNQNYSDRYVYGPYTAPALEPSHLDGEPVAAVLGRLSDVAELAGQNSQAVSDLEAVYGDTAAAAASAADAAGAAADAIAAAAQAVVAQGDAATSAASALGSKNAVETAKGQAQTYRDDSASSASLAQASAATAATQAGLATTARGGAEAASNAAVTAKNQASSHADAASIASAAATSASVTADLAAATALPSRPGDNLKYFTGTLVGPPSGAAALSSSVTAELVAGVGKVAQTSQPNWVITKGWVPIGTDRVHELVARIRVVADGAQINRTQVGFRLTNEAGLNGTTSATAVNHVQADGWLEVRFIRTSAQLKAVSSDSTHFRPGVLLAVQQASVAASGATVQAAEILYRDITEVKAAEAQAQAASTSASNASASSTAAGVSATAANNAKTGAETARGQAQAFASNAAGSADTAAAASSTATSQAGLATTARNEASGHAAAAAGSAATASSKANEAGTAAAAATAAQTSAGVAKDQALAALAQQGRLNLVQKSRVSGSPVAFADTQSGWGYRIEGGGTTSRSSYVGPLKPSTPYSISFIARRVSGTVEALNVDLFPDTLPEKIHIINSASWTEYKWEGVTSSSADMASANVQLRFFRAGLVAGNVFEISDIKIEEGGFATAWTPNPKDIELAASAAATSASQAAASQTAAGASATAASGAATNAATSAGQAQTYRNEASSSAASAQSASSSAGTSASSAEGSATSAAASAATALAQASSASAMAASAALSADLASGVSVNANLMANGSGENGTAGWYSPLPGFYVGEWAPYGGRIVKQELSGTIPLSYLSCPWASIEPGQTITASWRGWLEGFTGTAMVYITWRSATGAYISETPRVPLAGTLRKITGTAPAGAYRAMVVIAVQGTGSSHASIAINRVKIEDGPNATAYTTDKSNVDLQAALSVTAATAVDVASRMSSVSFGVTGGAGGDPFEIMMKAGSGGSMATVSATAILLRNIIAGNAVEALKLINGEAYFGAPVSVTVGGRRLTIGPGFGVSSGLVMWFGPGGTAIGSMSRTNGYFALGTDGKVYYGTGELPSGGGGGGAGGAAMVNETIAAAIGSGGFQTIASASFANRPSAGFWTASVSGLSGSSDGFADNMLEFRVIEQGATAAWAMGTATVPAGMTSMIDLALSDAGPWAQTQSAGTVTLLLQARRIGGDGISNITNGRFTAQYTPGV